jgi:hypothetical protein
MGSKVLSMATGGTTPPGKEGEDGELERHGEVQQAGKRVAEARKKAEWETHFAKQDAHQQSENSKDFGYERAAVGHKKPVL